jgi:hypothetical protein
VTALRAISKTPRLAESLAQVEKGADTLVYLASSPEVAHVNGGYFYKCRPATPSGTSRHLDRIEAQLDNTSLKLRTVPLPGSIE